MRRDEFEGVIGPTWRESTPWWPPEPAPPEGAPNIVLIVLDDVGYAQLGCYGSDISTPNIDALAAGGLRLSNFHTTALCSPTRACLLTGRNHHSNGMARVADLALGFPGYCGRIPREHAFLSEVLGDVGYAPVAVGKWHLTPEDETHMAAPRSSWPCARGFQRWYGFHGGETHQFVPALFQDNHAVVPPVTDDYHLSVDLADRAIRYLGDIRSVAPEQPFFLYFATGACHSPHHAPASWIERYAGHFDGGWDAWREATFARQLASGLLPEGTLLTPRPPWVPAWDSLDADEQRVSARFMECFAGFLSHADEQIGRVLSFVTALEEPTLVMLVSDNGASSEGGRRGSINDARMWNGSPAGKEELRARIDELGTASAHNNYPWGWTMAGNTPFRRWKREVHEGGIADPCIVWWPGRVAAGEIRTQFTHAIDVMPTVLSLAGVPVPEGVEGTSFAYLVGDGGAAEPEQHTTQYFEMLGSRAIYSSGWKAVAFHPIAAMYHDGLDPDAPFEDDVWELYHVASDLSESSDLAAAEPERLVQPDRFGHVFWPHGALVPETVAPNLRNRTHSLAAHVSSIGDGVLLAMGTALGGWSFQVHEGRLRYVHNYLGAEMTVIASPAPIPADAQDLAFELETAGDMQGVGRLLVDGTIVAIGSIARLTPVRYSITGGGMTCGWEQGPAIGTDYTAPFRYSGELRCVEVSVGGTPYRDPEAEFEAIMSEQ